MVRATALPNQIPPQTVPLTVVDAGGRQICDFNWYLFLYNLAHQVLSPAGVVLQPGDYLPFTEIDAQTVDWPQSYRQVVNSVLLQQDPEVVPPRLDWLWVQDLPDPAPRAQPVTVIGIAGGSPATYTAPFNGTVVVNGGTVSVINLIRQGTTVVLGITGGLIPVSRLDQVQITYTVAPTATFVPT